MEVRTAALTLYQTIRGKVNINSKHNLSRKQLYHRLHWLRTTVLAVYLGLTFFEKPSWCSDNSYDFDCVVHLSDRDVHVPMSGLPTLPQRILHSVELACLLGIVGVLLLRSSFARDSKTSRLRTQVILFLCAVATADNVQVMITQGRVYVAHFMRPIIFMLYVREVRECIIRIWMVLVEAKGVVALICAHVISFSWLGVFLFSNIGESYYAFDNMTDAMWNLTVLLTTCNFPDIMLPAYAVNRLYCLYFVVYLVFGVFVLLNLLLGAFYNNYRSQLEAAALNFINKHRRACTEAFTLLDCGFGYVTEEVLLLLLDELRELGMDIHYTQRDFILSSLDDHGLGTITRLSFFEVIRVLREAEANSKSIKRALAPNSTAVLESLFEVFGNSVRLINFLTVLLSELLRYNGFGWFFYSQWFFMGFYWAEMALKLWLMKFYFKSYCNWLDFLLNLGSLVMLCVYIGNGFASEYLQFNLFTFLRVLRILTVLAEAQPYQVVFNTLLNIIPSFSTLLGVIIVMFYLFSLAGIELFGGKVYPENSSIKNDASLPPNYVLNNFNDFAGGLLTLFELVVLNNWQVVSQTFVDVTSKVAHIYFVLFYFMSVLVVFNLMIAFIIDTFISQADIKPTASANEIQQDDRRLRRSKSLVSQPNEELNESVVTQEQALVFMRQTLTPGELVDLWRSNA
jgi:two pore calcium channel protein